MRSAVVIAADGQFGGDTRDELLEVLGGIYAVEGLLHAVAGKGIRDARVAVQPHDHARAGRHIEYTLGGVRRNEVQAEIGPEPGAGVEVVDTVDDAFHAQNCHDVFSRSS